MQPLTKQIIERHGIRFRKDQKQAFFNALRDGLEPLGLEPRQSADRMLLKNHNIVVGDPEKAELLFTAHYDTPPRMRVPANIILPRSLLLSLLYQLAWVLAIFALSFAATAATGLSPFWAMELGLVLFIALAVFLFMGGANKNNRNDNTSGVATLTELMAALPERLRHRAAFVFFDHEEFGLLGSSAFAGRHGKKLSGKIVVNIDCVGDGDEILFFPSKAARADQGFIERLNASLCPQQGKKLGVASEKGWFFPSDQMSFRLGVGVGAFRRSKAFGLYMNRIHTARDTVLDENNLQAVVQTLAALLENTDRAQA
ncbi:MAG: M28 family peptidase [Bacillota bacterium]